MKKNQILCFSLIMLLILPIMACNFKETGIGKKTDADKKEVETINNRGTTSGEKAETVNGQGTGLQGETKEPGKETKESGEKEIEIKTPTEKELIDFIHNAESTFLTLCAEGFEAEFSDTKKKEFNEISEDLLKYYTKNYLYPTWENFYENHLGEWGYGMGELFIFSDYDTIKNNFVRMSKEEEQLEVYFSCDMGSDEYYGFEDGALEYIYVLVQTDGKWLIDKLLRLNINPYKWQ